jgi:hypothetical protein
MASAQIFIDGQSLEFMGNVTDKFTNFINEAEASRSGRVFVKSEAKAKMLSVDSIKVNPRDFEEFVAFFSTCGSRRFTLTVVLDDDCDDGSLTIDYLNAFLVGEPENSFFERTISGFEVAYETRVTTDG